ncbi:hypothetical protein [Streptomyces cellulosae]|uniref:hypothetical protein n=1 Tax=Streptomyces cellulosae TaxID=1968 RepID=UPI00131CA083|nr:hypothetical protein [Streptomyces cellulosae]
MTVSATTVHPGDTVTFHGSGFTPGQQVDVLLRPPNTVLGTFTADANGNVSGQVTIPPGTKPGYYQFALLNHGGSFRVCAAVIRVVTTQTLRAVPGGPVDAARQSGAPVDAAHQSGAPVEAAYHGGTPTHSGLADTGSGKALALGGAAAGLIAAGGGTMLAVRRRRSS